MGIYYYEKVKMYKIYYGDKSTIEVNAPEDIPLDKRTNVQAIVWNDPDKNLHDIGRFVLNEWDFYIYSDTVGSWHGTNKYCDLIQHLLLGCGKGGVRCVLQGRWIERNLYREIIKLAETDTGFDTKSAKIPRFEDGSTE